jgi:hypothetical protein
MFYTISTIKGKGKFYLGHVGQEGEQKYTSTLSLTLELDSGVGDEWSR